jgi:large-conductance mechanosensitive channel
MAPVDNPFQMPDFSLWDIAEWGVQNWNMIPVNYTALIQAALLIVLVGFGLFMVIKFLRSLTNEEATEQ